MFPLVSIIVPVFNRSIMGSQAINSALNQTYDNIEIIVGDNCSDDGTFECLCKEFGSNSKVKLFRNEENLGPVRNWIECLKRATGLFIKILWSDDLLDPSFVEKTVTALCSDSSLSFAYSKVGVFRDSVENNTQVCRYGIGPTGKYEDKDFYDALIKNHNAPSSPGCAIFRRDTLSILSEFPDSVSVNALSTGAGTDLLMFLIALKKKPRFFFIDEQLCFFREHSGSISIANPDVPKGYICAKKYFFSNYASYEYLDWMKAENRIFAKLGVLSASEIAYCKQTGVFGKVKTKRIYLRILIHYIKRKIHSISRR